VASRARIRRLVRLIDLLASGRAHSAADLARLCAVSRRTLFRDLGVLRDAGLPIEFDESRRGFLLERSTFLRPTDFTVSEALSLIVLCDSAGSSDGIPFQAPARSAALKLLSALPPLIREHVGEVAERVAIRVGPVNPLSSAGDIFAKLANALRERRQVRIRYDSLFDKREIRTLLSPYRLMFQRRSWYIIGRSSIHRAVRTFNVGRILDADIVADSSFQIPPRFTLERYFGDAWSFIRDRGKRYEVVVRFQPRVARNVAEVQWHRTQRVTWNDDGSLNYAVMVEGLEEIVWWVLGYGREAEVLTPPELRARLRDQLDALAAVYSNG
jgi:predicted DNA-binding transcriptional regulator YafY